MRWCALHSKECIYDCNFQWSQCTREIPMSDPLLKMCPRTDRACLCPSACQHTCFSTSMAGNRVCCGEPFCCQTPDEPCVPRLEAKRAARQEMQERTAADAAPAPSVSAARKASPVFSGVLNYFPDALMAVARVSKAGNDKHNPGQPLHWSREKSNDHMDCAARHMLTPYEIDPDSKEVHLANAVWRLLAELQILQEEKNRGA